MGLEFCDGTPCFLILLAPATATLSRDRSRAIPPLLRFRGGCPPLNTVFWSAVPRQCFGKRPFDARRTGDLSPHAKKPDRSAASGAERHLSLFYQQPLRAPAAVMQTKPASSQKLCRPFPKSVLDKTPRLPYNSTVVAQPEAFAAWKESPSQYPGAPRPLGFSLRHLRFLVAQAEQTDSKTRPTPTRGQVAAAGRTASRRLVRGGRPGGEIPLAGAARRAGRPRRGRRRP